MTDNHPITPPDELVRKWLENYFGCWDNVTTAAADVSRYIAAKSTQWRYEQRGAANEAELQKARDEELEACCAEMREHWGDIHNAYGWELSQNLRDARRPKPKSQAEEALDLINRIEYNATTKNAGNEKAWDLEELEGVRRALKRLQGLEEKAND